MRAFGEGFTLAKVAVSGDDMGKLPITVRVAWTFLALVALVARWVTTASPIEAVNEVLVAAALLPWIDRPRISRVKLPGGTEIEIEAQVFHSLAPDDRHLRASTQMLQMDEPSDAETGALAELAKEWVREAVPRIRELQGIADFDPNQSIDLSSVVEHLTDVGLLDQQTATGLQLWSGVLRSALDGDVLAGERFPGMTANVIERLERALIRSRGDDFGTWLLEAKTVLKYARAQTAADCEIILREATVHEHIWSNPGAGDLRSEAVWVLEQLGALHRIENRSPRWGDHLVLTAFGEGLLRHGFPIDPAPLASPQATYAGE